jgi:hypothetical protein
MIKNKFFIIALLALVSFTSCGIFHKPCNCPHFTQLPPVKTDSLAAKNI